MTAPDFLAYAPLPEGYGPGLAVATKVVDAFAVMAAPLRAQGATYFVHRVQSPATRRPHYREGLYLMAWRARPDREPPMPPESDFIAAAAQAPAPVKQEEEVQLL